MIDFKKIFKIFFILHFVIITGCANYTQLSNNERLVSYKVLSGETKYFVEKFDTETESWFRAKCNNTNHKKNYEDCINNTEFTEISKILIAGLLSNNDTSINENENSNKNDEEEDEEENEEEDEEEDEDNWDEDDWT